MDRFRKSMLQPFRVKWSEFVRQNWHNASNGDYFRSLDGLAMLGAMRYNPKSKWQHLCWRLYRLSLGLSFVVVFFVPALEAVTGNLDFQTVAWHSTKLGTACVVLLKELLVYRYFDSIQSARDFLNSNPSNSGNKGRDSRRRQNFFQRIQLIMLFFHVGWVLDLITMYIPNSGVNKIFLLPQVLRQLSPNLSGWIHIWYTTTLCPWYCKYFIGTGFCCAVLSGCKMELGIFVDGFGNILDNVQLDVQENLPPATAVEIEARIAWRLEEQEKLFWKYLKQHVVNQVEQHVKLQEINQLLQPVVRWLYGLIYYNAITLVGLLVYIIFLSKPSGISLCFGSVIVFVLLECFWWSYVIESFQDENETLEAEIFHLMAEIPYSKEYHKEYVEMRTMLFIMVINVRNSAQFSCGGVFPISVETFCELVGMTYSLVTFMLNFGKRAYY